MSTLVLGLLLCCAGCNSADSGSEVTTAADTAADTTAPTAETTPAIPEERKLGRILILHEPGKPASYEEALSSNLSAITEVVIADWDSTEAASFTVEDTELVILTGADRIDGGLLNRAAAYRKKGGNVTVLGGPLCETIPFKREDGSYATLNEFLSTSDSVTLQLDPSDKKQIAKITRTASNPAVKHKKTGGDFGMGHASLKLENGYFDGWDVMIIPYTPKANDNAVCFYAKAEGAATYYMELVLDDGTRYLGPAPETTADWSFYTIRYDEFGLYPGSGTTPLSADRVKTFMIGGTGLTEGQGYTMYLDTLASASFSVTDESAEFEHLTTPTDFYQITNAKALTAYAGQAVIAEADYIIPEEIYSTLRASEGTGYLKERDFRLIPLLEAFDEKGLHSGWAAWINLYDKGSLTAFPMGDAFFDENGIAAVADAARLLINGSHFTEAGTRSYVYEENTEKIEANAAFYAPEGAVVRYSFTSGDKLLKSEEITVAPTGSKERNSISLSLGEDGIPDRIKVELLVGERTVDVISHPILVMGEDISSAGFVTMEDGAFRRNGEAIHMHGVNYFGSYGAFGTHFACDALYDPYLVRCDLERIKEIGFNAVSLQVGPWDLAGEVESGYNKNMTQVVAIARELGLYVDMYVPFYENIERFGELVKLHRFDEFDNITAYDIIWEGSVGTYASLDDAGKAARSNEWVDWINLNYGSIGAASAAFGITCPETADFDALLCKANASPAEAALATAFRRFMDEKISTHLLAATERIRGYDPNHLISFRCCDSGYPSAASGSYKYNAYLYDFSSFCGALDFVSPEGYGYTRYQFDATAYEGAFAADYAELVCGDTTTICKEFGWSAFSGSNYEPNEAGLAYAAEIYTEVYDALYMGEGGGSYIWWYTGGYRPGEGSDYGVVNPDGSDRPGTKVVREYAERMLSIDPLTEKETVTFTVDRDLYADGLAGIWASIKDEYIAALDSGKRVKLVSAGSGMTVAEAASIALTDGTDTSPRKYLSCVIAYAEDSTGKEITAGGSTSDKSVTLTLANTGYTSWGEGDVILCGEDGSVLCTLPALAQGERANVTITLTEGTHIIRASAQGIPFGTPFTINVK